MGSRIRSSFLAIGRCQEDRSDMTTNEWLVIFGLSVIFAVIGAITSIYLPRNYFRTKVSISVSHVSREFTCVPVMLLLVYIDLTIIASSLFLGAEAPWLKAPLVSMVPLFTAIHFLILFLLYRYCVYIYVLEVEAVEKVFDEQYPSYNRSLLMDDGIRRRYLASLSEASFKGRFVHRSLATTISIIASFLTMLAYLKWN